MRMLGVFQKSERVRHIGHLDIQRAVQRGLRRSGLPVDESFGFRAETRDYTFCLRCTPRRGDYNFYLYAYDKNAQREHARSKDREKPIREHKVSHKTMNNEMER